LIPCGELRHLIRPRKVSPDTTDISPVLRAEKGARLIRAAAAEMAALSPTIQERAFLKGPVLIIGGGVASWTAAKEAAQEGLDFMMSPGQEDLHCLLQNLHWTYPGESELHPRLEKIVREVLQSPRLRMLPPGELVSLRKEQRKFSAYFIRAGF
ncbi:MAG: hypothetical protein ACOC0T_05325, partial [Desulfovermiculus sp.]